MALKDYRLENLPRSIQIVLVVGLAVGLGLAAYMFYLRDMLDTRSTLELQVDQLEAVVAQGKAFERQHIRYKEELAQVEERLKVLRAILPDQKETPIVLRNVQEMANLSNLKIVKFIPQPVVPRAFYSDWPIRIEVQGSYHALGLFFEKISQFTRIVNVDNISIKGIEGSIDAARTLTAVCTATTFVYREEQVAAPPAN